MPVSANSARRSRSIAVAAVSLYLVLKNNPDDFVNATERAAQLLEQAAALEHTWALDLIATQNRRAEERQAAASRAAGEKAMADLLGLILAAAATAGPSADIEGTVRVGAPDGLVT